MAGRSRPVVSTPTPDKTPNSEALPTLEHLGHAKLHPEIELIVNATVAKHVRLRLLEQALTSNGLQNVKSSETHGAQV